MVGHSLTTLMGPIQAHTVYTIFTMGAMITRHGDPAPTMPIRHRVNTTYNSYPLWYPDIASAGSDGIQPVASAMGIRDANHLWRLDMIFFRLVPIALPSQILLRTHGVNPTLW